MSQRIYLITTNQVKRINEEVCRNSSSEHRCYDLGKIESALHSAFYPGSYPFYHGGVARLAGALAYYILKAHAFFDGNKRTALLASTAFMALNGWELRYPMPNDGWCDLAKILDSAAANLVGMEELKDWYEQHKTTT